ncbi:MAG: hypothetical protein Sylvanvirus23_5 [Sylvanvirus sp.]|uniref:Uncharacterized protein n=1 Tax=Sylvanvirus sp. TaxID=2487774 RepID=A0A3G5AIR9_9VIRU|nr:MAG: hypothetical protein Sylvanvirus23_5 [Sylvanvirus sp.]
MFSSVFFPVVKHVQIPVIESSGSSGSSQPLRVHSSDSSSVQHSISPPMSQVSRGLIYTGGFICVLSLSCLIPAISFCVNTKFHDSFLTKRIIKLSHERQNIKLHQDHDDTLDIPGDTKMEEHHRIRNSQSTDTCIHILEACDEHEKACTHDWISTGHWIRRSLNLGVISAIVFIPVLAISISSKRFASSRI